MNISYQFYGDLSKGGLFLYTKMEFNFWLLCLHHKDAKSAKYNVLVPEKRLFFTRSAYIFLCVLCVFAVNFSY